MHESCQTSDWHHQRSVAAQGPCHYPRAVPGAQRLTAPGAGGMLGNMVMKTPAVWSPPRPLPTEQPWGGLSTVRRAEEMHGSGGERRGTDCKNRKKSQGTFCDEEETKLQNPS